MMTNNCLILGPSGRFGRHTMTEFISRGWVVTPFRRNVDDLETLAANADVIVFGWHLKYSDWETQLRRFGRYRHRRGADQQCDDFVPWKCLYVWKKS